MSNQSLPSGLSAEIKKKLNEKRDPEQEREVLEWIEKILGKSFDHSEEYEDILHSGVVLCQLINAIRPGSVKRINDKTTMPFKVMENINAFTEAITRYGVPVLDLFQTIDLFEKKNISQVTKTLFALGRTCQTHDDYQGPILGPKLAHENKRCFDDEQLKSSSNIIGLQMGSNKGASQAGMTMGKQRMIID